MKSRKKLKITSGKIIVSDPCYSDNNIDPKFKYKKQGTFKAKNGNWKVSTLDIGERTAELMVLHEDVKDLDKLKFKRFGSFCVDAGSQGFFDYSEYGSHYDYWPNDKALIVEKTGVIAHSGYGDGIYDCYISRKNGEVIAAVLVFIYPEDLLDEPNIEAKFT